jgi:hypothetical protein
MKMYQLPGYLTDEELDEYYSRADLRDASNKAQREMARMDAVQRLWTMAENFPVSDDFLKVVKE